MLADDTCSLNFDRKIPLRIASERIDDHDIDLDWEQYRLAHRHTGGAATLLERDARIPEFPVVHAEVLKAKRYMTEELTVHAAETSEVSNTTQVLQSQRLPHPLSFIIPEVA